jgi:DNA anti-recombination protein RmuC
MEESLRLKLAGDELRRESDAMRNELSQLRQQSAELNHELLKARDAQVSVLPEFEQALKRLRAESEERLRELIQANQRTQDEIARCTGHAARLTEQLVRREHYYSQLRFRLAERVNSALKAIPGIHQLLKAIVNAGARAARAWRPTKEVVR